MFYCVGMVSVTSASRYQSRPDVHPRSDSTDFHGIDRGSSDWSVKIRPEDHRLASQGLPKHVKIGPPQSKLSGSAHEATLMRLVEITCDACEGQMFLSNPHTNNGLFFLTHL